MATETKSIQSLAGELYEALETRTRNNGQEFVCLMDGSPEWMTDVIHAAHGDSMPDDTIYSFIEKAAGALNNLDEDASDDDRYGAIYEIEADVYTSDLTAWLHQRPDHVEYLTLVLEEFGGDVTDGFQLLILAQKKQIEEVGLLLIQALEAEVSRQIEKEG